MSKNRTCQDFSDTQNKSDCRQTSGFQTSLQKSNKARPIKLSTENQTSEHPVFGCPDFGHLLYSQRLKSELVRISDDRLWFGLKSFGFRMFGCSTELDHHRYNKTGMDRFQDCCRA